MSSKKKQGGDERFLRVQKDPRFWEMPEREHKVKIDKRFQSMFHDKRFTEKYTVDKRGRPINQTSKEDLKRFYKLSDSEEEEEEEDAKSKKSAEGKKKKKVKEKLGKVKLVKEKLGTADGEVQRGDGEGQQPERGVRVIEESEDEEDDDDDDDLGDSVTDDSGDEEDDDDDDDDDDDSEEGSDVESGSGEEEEEEEESGLDSDSDSEPDLARGKGNVETSSDEDDDDVDAILQKEEEEIEHDWGELAKDAPRSDEVSNRLAVCNMDWDRIKAKDLLALINSFVPKEGAVLSVKVYPSEFGKERLKAEQTKGPLELKALPDDSEDDNEEERGYREKMRDYQFKRLKYYYAVVECDSADTAAKVYQECDGYEYESSCSVLDLRFIPDEVKFDEEPRDVATDVNLSAYTPRLFTSSANATSKVELTWDETDNDRVTALSRKFNKDELLAMDFNAYLASSSEEEEGEEGGFVFGEQESEDEDDTTAEAERTEEPVVEKKPPKEEKKKKKSEEQISKYRELLKGIRVKEKKLHEDKDMEMEITWVPGLKETTEQLVKKKLEGTDKLTPWEEFLQKKKDRKKQKKSQRKEGEEEEELSDEDLPPDVDLSDPFFAEELAATDVKKKQKWKKKKKKQEEEERTPEEEERLEQQKAEMALLMEDDGNEAGHKHFNYDKIVEEQNLSKKKRKKLQKKGDEPPEGDDFQVDVKDPRFQAMFTSHLFNLDPSNPNYKKTKATQSILVEKQRRRRGEEEEEEERRRTMTTTTTTEDTEAAGRKRENDSSAPPTVEGTSKKAMDPGLSLLIKSIKSKTEQFQARKKPKLM